MKPEELKQTPADEGSYPVSNADLSAAIMQTHKLIDSSLCIPLIMDELAAHLTSLLEIQKNRAELIHRPKKYSHFVLKEKQAAPVEEKNPRRDWSPLHVKLLLHAHCCPAPWTPRTATSDKYYDDLIQLGLIKKTPTGNYQSTVKGSACVEKICQLIN